MSKRPKPRPARANGKGRPAVAKPSGKPPVPAPVVVWPVPAPPPPGPAPEAVAQYEAGIAAFQKQNYNEAAETFRRLLEAYPREGSLADRARVYLGLCERALAARPSGPQTAEERLTAATAALNDGDLTRAEELARAVLDADPHQDLALYLLAAVASRQGRPDEALDRLARAIALSPEVSAQARHDDDFEPLHDLEQFWKLTELPPPEARGGGRRPKRSRPG
jgi:tetratricopeptide (TPR) repeat protein